MEIPESVVQQVAVIANVQRERIVELEQELEKARRASYTMPSTWNPLMQALSELYRVYSKRPRLTYGEVDSKVAALMEIYDEWLD